MLIYAPDKNKTITSVTKDCVVLVTTLLAYPLLKSMKKILRVTGDLIDRYFALILLLMYLLFNRG